MKSTFKSVVLNCLGLSFSLYSSAVLRKTINKDETARWMGDIRVECRLLDGKARTHISSLCHNSTVVFLPLNVGYGL